MKLNGSCSLTLFFHLMPGVGLIPGPVHYLHITSVTEDGVVLSWEPPSEGANVTLFQVHYESTSNNSASPEQYELNNVSQNIVL